jgi:hypothetical protein
MIMDKQNEKAALELLQISLNELEKTNHQVASVGACIFTPPSGRPRCLQLTHEQCEAIKGEYIGGPCGDKK